MVHAIQQIFNNASAFGEMLKNPRELPPGVTAEELLSFLQSIIKEQASAYDLKHANWDEVREDIRLYFDVKMTNEKNKLVAEEGSEAAMEIVSGAAAIAAAAGSWIPFVNFALEATALVALAAQTGLEIAVESLEGTIVEDLANADTNISKSPSFAKILPYSDAVKKNTSMFPRIQLGGKTSDLRAMFLSLVVATKKQNAKGEVTVDALKQQFIDIYNASNDSVLGPIMAEYTRILSEIEDNLAQGATPPDTDALSKKLDPLLKEVDPIAIKAFSSITMMLTGVITARYGKQAYSLWKAGNEVVQINGDELVNLNEENEVAEGAEAGVLDEVSTLSKMDIAVKAVGVLAAVASFVFAGLEIKAAVDTESNLTKAFEDSKTAITDYYRQVCGAPNENIPKAPFPVGMNPIEAGTGDAWAMAILGQADWTVQPGGGMAGKGPKSGTFNTSKQCMESVNEGGGLWCVITSGSTNAVKTTSYVCVGGTAAKYVDVAVYPGGPNTKYLGWNGSKFTLDPAIDAGGYYWYKLEVDWYPPFADGLSVFYAKTYRAPKSMKSGDFKIWAFDESSLPTATTPPPSKLPEGPIAFKSYHGTYLRAHPGGQGSKLDLQVKIGGWEQFTIVPVPNGKYAIRSIHGTYLRAHPGGQGSKLDLQVKIGGWEQFTIVPVPN